VTDVDPQYRTPPNLVDTLATDAIASPTHNKSHYTQYDHATAKSTFQPTNDKFDSNTKKISLRCNDEKEGDKCDHRATSGKSSNLLTDHIYDVG
jgi:hypothetical protein